MPLTTMALATAGATKPGIEPMQLVSPRIVPLIDIQMKTLLFKTRRIYLLFKINFSTFLVSKICTCKVGGDVLRVGDEA